MAYTKFTALNAGKILKADTVEINGVANGYDKIISVAIAADSALTDEQAKAKVINLVPSAAKNLTLNMKSAKVFYVRNLGEFDVTLKSGSGSVVATADRTAVFFCNGANSVIKVSAEVDSSVSTGNMISSFSLPNQVGSSVIDHTNGTITAIVAGSRASMAATFTASIDAEITVGGIAQVSGTTTNNFTAPVTYLVTAEDGTEKEYIVTVSLAKYSLSITADEEVTVEVTVGGEPVEEGVEAFTYGDVATITATASTGYVVSSLTLNGDNFTSGETYDVFGNVSIVAEAEEQPSGNLLVEPVEVGSTLNFDGVNLGYSVGLELGKNYEIKYTPENGTQQTIQRVALAGDSEDSPLALANTIILGNAAENAIFVDENTLMVFADKCTYGVIVQDTESYYSDENMTTLVGTLANNHAVTVINATVSSFIGDGTDGTLGETYYVATSALSFHPEYNAENSMVCAFNFSEEEATTTAFTLDSIEEITE